MSEFHVEYRIEVEADTHEQAARKVARMLANGGAARGSYAVRTHPARFTLHPEFADITVDLGEIDGTWSDASDETDWVAEIDGVMREAEESTEAGEMEAVFAARDATYDLLARIRRLMAVPDAG